MAASLQREFSAFLERTPFRLRAHSAQDDTGLGHFSKTASFVVLDNERLDLRRHLFSSFYQVSAILVHPDYNSYP